jgi:hypothetical protein
LVAYNLARIKSLPLRERLFWTIVNTINIWSSLNNLIDFLLCIEQQISHSGHLFIFFFILCIQNLLILLIELLLSELLKGLILRHYWTPALCLRLWIHILRLYAACSWKYLIWVHKNLLLWKLWLIVRWLWCCLVTEYLLHLRLSLLLICLMIYLYLSIPKYRLVINLKVP